MKILFAFFIIISFFSISAQERVGNGEGLSEQRITTINEFLPHYISLCQKGGCMMNEDELEKLNNLQNVRYKVPTFSFISGYKNPGVFEATGMLSVIRTTQNLTSEIKVNIDKLYTQNQAVTLEEALVIVVYAYSYKGNFTYSELFTNKLSFALTQSITTIQHSFNYPYIRSSLYLSSIPFRRTLIVNDGKFSFNLGKVLFEHFNCSDDQSMILKKVYWVENDKRFILAVDANYQCSLTGNQLALVEFNIKNFGSSFPGDFPKIEFDPEKTIRFIEVL